MAEINEKRVKKVLNVLVIYDWLSIKKQPKNPHSEYFFIKQNSDS